MPLATSKSIATIERWATHHPTVPVGRKATGLHSTAAAKAGQTRVAIPSRFTASFIFIVASAGAKLSPTAPLDYAITL